MLEQKLTKVQNPARLNPSCGQYQRQHFYFSSFSSSCSSFSSFSQAIPLLLPLAEFLVLRPIPCWHFPVKTGTTLDLGCLSSLVLHPYLLDFKLAPSFDLPDFQAQFPARSIFGLLQMIL